MTLRLPLDALPIEPHERHGRLRDYFCDKDAKAVRVDGEWHLELAWPGGAERHVDPRIETELDDWNGITLSGMGTARRRSGRVMTALYDTWTLYDWARWVARTNPSAQQRITILHLDDHRDLGSPRLLADEGRLVDMITGCRFDLRDPASVLMACESGAVGMGSFLTPFLLAFPNCDVRQLGQPPKIHTTVDYAFLPSIEMDDLLHPGSERPAIRLELAEESGMGRYRATNDLDDWLADIGDGPVLLHVDMDYFNNRFDGNGDWPDFVRHDPPLDDVLKEIDRVVAAIESKDILERIEAAAVAFSPGFFPAEMWRPAEARLRAGLRSLYD